MTASIFSLKHDTVPQPSYFPDTVSSAYHTLRPLKELLLKKEFIKPEDVERTACDYPSDSQISEV